MNEEKQLDELIKDVFKTTSLGAIKSKEVAEALFREGYHKQSEGEWIDKPTGAYGRMQSWCSACGKHSGIGGIESNRHKSYCPNCGARMDGGADE